MENIFNSQLGIIPTSNPQPKTSLGLNVDLNNSIGPKPPLFKTNKVAFVDSVLKANNHLDWVKRLHEKNAPSIKLSGQPYSSTHEMADDGKGYVYPTIVRINGRLVPLTEDQAYDYAKKTNTGIQLPKEQGTWFSNNGYKIGTGVNNDISPTGIPFNSPVYFDSKGNLQYK